MSLSVMITSAVRFPLAFGIKVTVIVQLLDAARLLPHVFERW